MIHLKLFKKINPCLLINNKNPLKLISSTSNKLANEDKRKLNSSKSKSIRDLRDKTEEEKRQSDLKNKGHENQNRVEKNESKQALKESQQTEDF